MSRGSPSGSPGAPHNLREQNEVGAHKCNSRFFETCELLTRVTQNRPQNTGLFMLRLRFFRKKCEHKICDVFSSMRSVGLWLSLLCAPVALSKPCVPKADLPPDASLRVGVKYKPEGCAESPKKSKKGDEMRIGYTGYLLSDCSTFDESYYEGFEFTLGEGHVIKGWDNGLSGMCVFEQRKLTIPAALAYGESGQCAAAARPRRAPAPRRRPAPPIRATAPRCDRDRRPRAQSRSARARPLPAPSPCRAAPRRARAGATRSRRTRRSCLRSSCSG
jgi:FK506-binding protein 2